MSNELFVRPGNQRAFDAVIFDLGSTLLYFDAAWKEVLPHMDAVLVNHLRTAGLVLDEESFAREFRARLEYYFTERDSEFIEYTTTYILRTLLAEKGFPDLPDGLIRSSLQAMYNITQAHWQLEEDAIFVLETLLKDGYRLGMISNTGDDNDVQVLVDKAGLRPYFEVILTSASYGIRKPDPRIFFLVLQNLGVSPERAVMVGDTLGADILGAHNAGMTGIWITRRAETAANRAHVDTIRPDAVISTLSELLDVLHRYGDG